MAVNATLGWSQEQPEHAVNVCYPPVADVEVCSSSELRRARVQLRAVAPHRGCRDSRRLALARKEAVRGYALWLSEDEPEQRSLREHMRSRLRGRRLLCHCASKGLPCHAEVIAVVANVRVMRGAGSWGAGDDESAVLERGRCDRRLEPRGR